MADFHSLKNRPRIRVSLIAISLGVALSAIGVAEEQSRSCPSVNGQPHHSESSSFFRSTTSPDFKKLLASELDKLNNELPRETMQRVRTDADRYFKIAKGDDGRLVLLISTLRYMREKRLFYQQQFNSTVQVQLNSLMDDVFDSFADEIYGPIPFGKNELRELCEQCPYTPVLASIDPYFRVPIAQHKEDEIRATLRARLKDMAKYRQLMWMSAPDLSLEERRILWRAFIRNTIRLLIVQPIIGTVNAVISEYDDKDASAISLAQGNSAEPVKEKFAPSESDETAFDLLRTSNERVFSVALSLLPMLADGVTASNANEWRSFLVNLHLKSTFPPYTEISTCMSIGVCKQWWVIIFAHLESNDGRLLAEQHLGGRCFVYDVDNWRLYEHLPDREQLSVLMEGIGQRFDGSVFFLNDYRCGDVLNALNCANSLSRTWTLHNPVYPSNTQTLSKSDVLSTVFGHWPNRCSLRRLNGQTVEYVLGNDRILLEGKRGKRGTILTNATLPSIGCSFHLAPNWELGDKGTYVPIHCTMFAQGVVIKHIAESSIRSTVILRAPGRVDVTVDVRQISNPLVRCKKEPDEEDATLFSAYLMRSNVLLNLHSSLDHIMADSVDGKRGMDYAAELYLLECLETEAVGIPRALQFYLDDIKTGLLLAMCRKSDALTLLAKQALLLQSNTDKEYVQAYLGFYTEALRHQATRVTSARTTLPCFLCCAAEEEKRGEDALEKGHSSEPYFTIDLKRTSLPGDNDITPREDIASRLYTLVGKQFGDGKMASYVKDQLDLLWEKFPDYRTVGKEPASGIASLWEAESQHITHRKDDYVRANEIALLLWRTYHCLVANHHPLRPEEATRKTSQLRRLEKVLERLDSEVTRQQADIPEGAHAAIRAEAQRCIRRLNEYSASPCYPLFFYPLSDDAFERAIDSIDTKLQKEIHRFIEEYSAHRKKLLDEALQNARNENRNVDFFQNSLRKWSNLQGRALVSLTMGNIVRHYCVVDRNLDYDDSTVFPFWKVKGISVVYRMQEGLSTELNIDWKVLTPHASDK